MSTKRNHALVYRRVPSFLRAMREEAGLTQRELADGIKQDQWWVARSETGSRRLDVAEFIEFAIGCGRNPTEALTQLTKLRR
jgi:transcriptional regulator with XRE-family HTH domain